MLVFRIFVFVEHMSDVIAGKTDARRPYGGSLESEWIFHFLRFGNGWEPLLYVWRYNGLATVRLE